MADWNVSDGLGGGGDLSAAAGCAAVWARAAAENRIQRNQITRTYRPKRRSDSRVPAHKSTSEIQRASARSRWTICIHTGALSSRLRTPAGDLYGDDRKQHPGAGAQFRSLSRRGHGIEEQPRRGERGDHRVQDAQPDEDAGGRIEIACQAFGQRAGREEGVAQRGDGSADAQNHHEGETDGGHPRRASADSGRRTGGSPTRRSSVRHASRVRVFRRWAESE